MIDSDYVASILGEKRVLSIENDCLRKRQRWLEERIVSLEHEVIMLKSLQAPIGKPILAFVELE